ncbi:isoprenoid synthase domain-containing protein [Halenospora varia]|nr:isoprenoid synthase domain-containing protein [Halenospora varia]
MGGFISAIFRWRSEEVVVSHNTRQKLLASLQGCSVTIPDLQGLFRQWPQAVNPEVERLRIDVDQKLESLFPEGKRLQQIKKANAALFASSWWPYADFETLRIATYLSIWLFVWDDETDSCEFSSLCSDFEKAAKFRAQTLDFIRKSLTPMENQSASDVPSNVIIAMFGEIGQAVFKSSTPTQVESFLNELIFFVDMTDLEQRCQMSEKLPTVEEYRKRRMGSSAVGVCVAITEYCFGMTIPTEVMNEKDMRTLWDETNIIISISNDIVSIKKEVLQEQVDTLIPLLTERHGSAQTAIDVAFKLLCASVESFERVSKRFLARHAGDKELSEKLEKFVDGCRYACTGNLNWSLGSGRYLLGAKTTENGVKVTL